MDAKKQIENGDFEQEMVDKFNQGLKQVEIDIEILRNDISELENSQLLLGIPVGYWKSLSENEGMDFINDVKVPVLVLQGSEDFQVFADVDYKLWEEVAVDNDNISLKLYDGLNHLMMQTNGKQDISDYQIKGEVSQLVIDDIVSFIND